MSGKNKLFKIGLPLLIIVAGIVVMLLMVLSRPAPQKEEKENPGVLADIITVREESHQVIVRGTGTVQARREASITSQVSGIVTYVSPSFVSGGLFNKGELLFEIEKVDYELNVDRARATLAQAELELIREESNAQVARQEWERLKKQSEDPNPLVLYEPQLKKAKANIASAKAALRQAELELQRTRLYAPFNCRIRFEEIDIGQYVRSGTSVGIVAGTDQAEIVIPLSISEIKWLKIPRRGSIGSGSLAHVRITSAGTTYEWKGEVTRSLGEVDEKGRMARIVITVDDPYRLSGMRVNGEPDLELGMFVAVDIFGGSLSRVILLPRDAVRAGDTVWVVDAHNKLRIQPVAILRSERENVIIKSGLADGDRVVITPLQGAAEGMKLRPLERELH
jgi:RND family efflux transporter MFP subunit